MAQAGTTALAFRTQQALTVVSDETGAKNRLADMMALFELMVRGDARALAVGYYEACNRLGRASADEAKGAKHS
jgi:hypothetical protein